MFTRVYLGLPMFTWATFTHVYSCLAMFSRKTYV